MPKMHRFWHKLKKEFLEVLPQTPHLTLFRLPIQLIRVLGTGYILVFTRSWAPIELQL